MDEYKTIGKNIEELLLICNSVLPELNEKILSNDSLNMKDIFRLYSTYLTSLNLLVGYSTSWNYSRKKTKFVIGRKSEKSAEYLEKVNKKFSTILVSVLEQFRVVQNTLEEFSKLLDHIKEKISKDDIKTLKDISVFLEDEIKDLDNVKLPKITTNKTGGNEEIEKILKQIPRNTYKVAIGGSDPIKYIGGAEVAYSVGQKLIQLHNIQSDLKNEKYRNETYYKNVFLPTMQKITSSVENLIKQGPEDKLKLLERKHQPMKNLSEQVLYSLDNTKKILEYYVRRAKTNFMFAKVNNDYHIQCEKINVDETIPVEDPVDSARKVFSVIKKIVKGIDDEDVRVVENIMEQEFSKYDSVEINKLEEELEENFHILTDENTKPTQRHISKTQYKKYISDLEDIFESSLDDSYNANVLSVKPCIKEKEIMAMEIPERMDTLCELMDYNIKMEKCMIPKYQNIEHLANSVASSLYKIVNAILSMVDQKNRQTCILRTSLLVTTLIRSKVIPILAKKRKKSYNEKLSGKVYETLSSLYSVSIDYNENEGIDQKTLNSIMNKCVL